VTFLLDENLSYRHAVRLRANGHDAVAAVELSLGGSNDAAVRSAAIKAGRVLVTLDADFGNIVRYPPQGTPGIIWLRLHPPSEAKIEQALDRCLDKLGKEDLAGKLAVVDADKIRVRG
jgi:predicted nuclease of predicted toxin-antitoxin system